MQWASGPARRPGMRRKNGDRLLFCAPGLLRAGVRLGKKAACPLFFLLSAACVRSTRADVEPALDVSELAARLPAKVADKDGWARDLELAFELDGLPLDEAHACAVIAVVDQESGFQ